MSMIKMLMTALTLFGASSIALAQSGSSGSSGTSGSAGLGIDTAALTVVSGGANPGIAVGKAGTGEGLGGPVTGLARHFQCVSGGGITCEKK